MKICDLAIDGFGVWRGLQLDQLSGQLNVFYGPNEAGKTTLLEFIRGALYGYSTERRRRYLPPRHGGEGGGHILLSSRHGDYRIVRHDTGSGVEGRLRVVDGVGRTLPPSTLDELLRHLDEAVFNHIFAIGIEELQELGTLTDDEVSARLYQLSTGLRGITLAQLLHELETSRERILATSEQPGQVTELLAQREQVRAELHDLRQLTGQYSELAIERDAVDQTVAELELRRENLTRETRIVELAIRVRPLWRRRCQLVGILESRVNYLGVGPDDVARLNDVCEQLRRRKKQVEESKPELEKLRSSLAINKVNDALWRQRPVIETLCDQQEWITGLENQLTAATAERIDLEAQQAKLCDQLGWEPGEEPQDMPAPQQTLAILRPVARAQQIARQALEAAQKEVRDHRDSAEGYTQQVGSALSGRSEKELAKALEQAGQRVSQLRKRVQLDEKIEQLQDNREELEEENLDLHSDQMLSPSALATLSGVFATGVAMLFGGLFLPRSIVGGHGLGIAVLGICASAGAVIAKLMIERYNEMNLETCSQQLAMVKEQIESAIADRDKLDEKLPRGGGPLLARLQAAEKDLASLEELIPLEGHRQASQVEAETAEAAVQRAEAELNEARQRWQNLLVELKLPASLRPKQLAEWGEQAEQWSRLNEKIAARKQEIADRQHALDALETRLAKVFEESKLKPVSTRIVEQMRQLRQAIAEQTALVDARNEKRKKFRTVRREAERAARLVAEFKLRRRTLLMAAGVDTEADFRARAQEQAETVSLRKELGEVRSDLADAMTEQIDEETLHPWLEEPSASGLDQHWEHLLADTQTVEADIRQKYEQRGQLNERLKALAADRRPSEKRLEFDLLNERLAEAIQRWQVLVVTHRLLDRIRELYQRERQPATLQEASRYFSAMTSGRYVRVWTPLSDDTLLVDDSSGHTLPIDVLSRGTREQLFLSLRLALAADYAVRGESFPLVLDDLLVNFDSDRARATAEVLKEFAATGHQVLLFTCHEHIKRLFQSLGVRVRRLPDNADSPAGTTTDELEPIPVPIAPAARFIAEPLPAPVERRVEPAAVLLTPPYAVPQMVGEADAFMGWPLDVEEEVKEIEPKKELVTVEDQSAFWALVARTQPWNAHGAEEFDGEFAEKIVEEVQYHHSIDRLPGTAMLKPRPSRRRSPAGARATEIRSRNGQDADLVDDARSRPRTRRGQRLTKSESAWDDDQDSDAA